MKNNQNFRTISARIPSALFDAISAEIVSRRRTTGENSSVSKIVRDSVAGQLNLQPGASSDETL